MAAELFSKGLLTLTMRTHLMRDRPKPEMAPYRPAADVVKQNDKKKPIQLKRNATGDRNRHYLNKHQQQTCEIRPLTGTQFVFLVVNKTFILTKYIIAGCIFLLVPTNGHFICWRLKGHLRSQILCVFFFPVLIESLERDNIFYVI